MVALSILFSYGLQFSAPSEIMWTHLEPWLHKLKHNTKFSINDEQATVVDVKTISSGCTNATAGFVTTTSSTIAAGEKKQMKVELKKRENVSGMYYVMRASMILSTCTYIVSSCLLLGVF